MKDHRRFVITVSFLSIMLLLSLGINFILYNRGELYYSQLNALRLDPFGLNYFQNSDLQKSERPLVVFFGDSRAASWPSPELGRFEFVNRGIGAQTSVQVLGRFDGHIQPLKPDIIVIQVGINDLKTIPLFPENKMAIVNNCKNNIRQIVEKSTDSGTTIILTTIFPLGEVPIERRPFWSDDVALAINQVNTFIQSMAGNKVIIFDTYSLLADDTGKIKPAYSKDLLHLTDTGYQRLNSELVSIIENLP